MPRDYFYELSARQAKAGHRVNVLTWKKNGGLVEEEMFEGFSVHRLHGLNLSLGGAVQEYPYLPGLPAKIEALRPEIIHVESHLFLTAFQAVRKAKELKLPCVVTIHGVHAERGKAINLAQSIYLHSIGLKVLRNADSVICLTRNDAEEIEKLGVVAEKIRFVSNAVDTRLFKPSEKREDDLVVWVGRFVQEKGLEYLIEAVRTVAQEHQGVRFLLIGYGPWKEKIVKMAIDYGLLGKQVTIIGPLTRTEIAQVLCRSTVFVLPSLSEGMPLALLEAMSCGNAVIASNVGGIGEIVRNYDSGVLASPRNAKELASSILMLLRDDGLRRKLARNGREAVEREHSWDSVLAQLDSVYESIRI